MDEIYQDSLPILLSSSLQVVFTFISLVILSFKRTNPYLTAPSLYLTFCAS
ncbi:hypothetical protein Syun_017167 [Stephania yunnanensis]|uniref:Uncharacterized protein n=1 Tax=Stephania yunnanensis TaxID=152371 RepID=A0AAP0J808_9MAGN